MKAIGWILLIAGVAINVINFMNINTGNLLSWWPTNSIISWCLRIGLIVLGLILIMAGKKKA